MKRLLVLACGVLLATACKGPTQIAEEHKRTAKIYMELGVGYMREGKMDLAMSNLQRSLELEPDYSDTHNAIAVLYEQLGNSNKAREHFQRSIRLDPKNSRARNNYGRFFCKAGKLAEAEVEFLAAVQNPLYRTPEKAYTNAGNCALEEPDVEKAEEYFRKALAVNSAYAPALSSMARLSFDLENYISARAYLQRYAEVASHSAETLWLGVRIERLLGDRNALATYSVALKGRFPDSEQTRLLLESERYERRRP
jgi:type IV pilus assembly protein PilF